MSDITCPYCFSRFKDNEVHFRSTSKGLSDTELIGLAPGDVKRHYRKYDKNEHTDKKLKTYWENRGGIDSLDLVDPGWTSPTIVPGIPSFAEMTNDEAVGGDIPDPEDRMVRDSDGFVTHVIDRLGAMSERPVRLCPVCHNPLPLADYGKYPVLFIGIVGITKCGKSVFLHQLLNNLGDFLGNTGFVLGTTNLNDLHRQNEFVEQDQPLPNATDTSVMRRPLAVTLKQRNGKKGVTLVFYDIAGENCVQSPMESPDQKARREALSEHIKMCNALMLLIDPKQIAALSVATDSAAKERIERIQNVIDAVNNLKLNGWRNVPVSIVITKSDLLEGNKGLNSKIFESLDLRNATGFYRHEAYEISKSLKEFLQDRANPILQSTNCFTCRSFFAVSAINCGVQSRFVKYMNEYSLNDENRKKIDDIREWAKGWEIRTPEERKYWAACPANYQNGDPITFDYDEEITQEKAEAIVTDVVASTITLGMIHNINLNLWEICGDDAVDLIDYPNGYPGERRTAEPLQWILWRLGVIGPQLGPEVIPRKKMLESPKAYEKRREEAHLQYVNSRKQFYWEDM